MVFGYKAVDQQLLEALPADAHRVTMAGGWAAAWSPDSSASTSSARVTSATLAALEKELTRRPAVDLHDAEPGRVASRPWRTREQSSDVRLRVSGLPAGVAHRLLSMILQAQGRRLAALEGGG
ncbi:hypothetical protein GCM10017559_82940 [Streptosporangium longisporum]|uniref:Uncharacterized protein n=1 Tax=Streptosporangium longisporum TaxID=46187 RepID=A0ABP6LH25_9ACTN